MGKRKDPPPKMIAGFDLFVPVTCIFVEEGIGPVRLKIFKTRMIEGQGAIKEKLNRSITHIIASSLAAAEKKFGLGRMSRYAKRNGLKVVSCEWVCQSLMEGGLLEESPAFDLLNVSPEEALRRKNEKEAEAQAKLAAEYWEKDRKRYLAKCKRHGV